MKDSIKFYSKLALFSVREEQSSLSGTLGGLLLYPCFIWIFSKLWLGLNHNTTSLGIESLFAYIGLTEILFMTTLREPLIERASSDFSLSFVRPRSWPMYTTISIYSRTLSRRLLYLLIYIIIMPLFIDNFSLSSISAVRFLAFLPLITILDSLYSFLLTSLQIRFYSTKNFRMLFGKLFLIFGGVLAPLSDIPEPWSRLFLNTPFSDLVFQPCYFSVKGNFYQITFFQWFARIVLQLTCLIGLSAWMYQTSRQHYHNFGG
jgi:ABC-type polysaccharide/polyol phosphate export permease